MPSLELITAGESHGPCILATVLGLPAGVRIDTSLIDGELARRQGGYGRGARQRIEADRAEYLSGVRMGVTTGAPLTIRIANNDHRLDDLSRTPPVHRPRPGHADLAGSIKWLTDDCRTTLERASARETAARVAAGAVARCVLAHLGVEVLGFVRSIGRARASVTVTSENWRSVREARDASETYCPDAGASAAQCAIIRQAKIDKDTVGGVCETHVLGCPPGWGTCVDWRRRLDARIAWAVMGIQAFKGVEIGLGFAAASRPGSAVHDPITLDRARRFEPGMGFVRPTNNAGGLEGGMTNGMPIVVRGAMKPISTLLRGLPSVDLRTGSAEQSQYERSDICAVSAASVVMENAIALEVLAAALDKHAGDTLDELVESVRAHQHLARERIAPEHATPRPQSSAAASEHVP